MANKEIPKKGPNDPPKRSVTRTHNFYKRKVEAQAVIRKKELFRKRIELANTGLKAFKERRPMDAVRAYEAYVKILEENKGVREGGLNPAHFDSKKDVAELFLISGVYWDLMKLYDRTRSVEKRRQMLHYLEKFILFSKGTAYQVLCAETLRKYILVEKPVHRSDFQQAYKLIAPPSKCFIATSLVDVSNPQTLPRLRRFRDRTLLKSRSGKAFVGLYYFVSPAFVVLLDRCPRFVRRKIAASLDRFARKISR